MVMVYARFLLSLRTVEDLLFERGRAVDYEGEVLESFVTQTRDKAAALAFIRKALKRHGRPDAIVTDGLRSYTAAMDVLGNAGTRRSAAGRTAGSRTPTCPPDDESGR